MKTLGLAALSLGVTHSCLFAPTLAAQWSSEHGGYRNDRRAVGERLDGGWKRAWSVTGALSQPLIADGRVCFVRSVDGNPRLVAHDRETGRQLWVSPQLPPSAGSRYRLASVAGRIFLSTSCTSTATCKNAANIFTQVAAYELRDGSHAWTWNSNVRGMAQMQALPAGLTGTGQGRVVFALWNRHTRTGGTSMWVLDAAAADAASAVVHRLALGGGPGWVALSPPAFAVTELDNKTLV